MTKSRGREDRSFYIHFLFHAIDWLPVCCFLNLVKPCQGRHWGNPQVFQIIHSLITCSLNPWCICTGCALSRLCSPPLSGQISATHATCGYYFNTRKVKEALLTYLPHSLKKRIQSYLNNLRDLAPCLYPSRWCTVTCWERKWPLRTNCRAFISLGSFTQEAPSTVCLAGFKCTHAHSRHVSPERRMFQRIPYLFCFEIY